jgi:uncharacterized protein
MSAERSSVPMAHLEGIEAGVDGLKDRLRDYDWQAVRETLAADGVATLPALIERPTARAFAAWYGCDELFRSRVLMGRHNFGRGEYKYFAAPLPKAIQTLREELYATLVPVANRWASMLRDEEEFPERHGAFIERCRAANQIRPTPLLLRYLEGDYNCLHQDLYGGVYFPLQVVILLSEPAEDFAGGELVLTEQRPRMQSRAQVVKLAQGDAAVFAVSQRPVNGKRGPYRVTMRHGVSTVTRGERHTLGIIFHDAT